MPSHPFPNRNKGEIIPASGSLPASHRDSRTLRSGAAFRIFLTPRHFCESHRWISRIGHGPLQKGRGRISKADYQETFPQKKTFPGAKTNWNQTLLRQAAMPLLCLPLVNRQRPGQAGKNFCVGILLCSSSRTLLFHLAEVGVIKPLLVIAKLQVFEKEKSLHS